MPVREAFHQVRGQPLRRRGAPLFASLSVVTTSDVAVTACPALPAVAAGDPSGPLCLFVSAAVGLADLAPAAVRLDIAHHFANLPDPRHPAFRDRHSLTDILVIALTGLLCGAKSW